MSDEINDKISQTQVEEHQGAEALFLKVHEADKASVPRDLARQLELNEKAIADALEKVANLAMRAFMFQHSDEPHHFETIREMAAKGAAANEPAYSHFHNHLC